MFKIVLFQLNEEWQQFDQDRNMFRESRRCSDRDRRRENQSSTGTKRISGTGTERPVPVEPLPSGK